MRRGTRQIRGRTPLPLPPRLLIMLVVAAAALGFGVVAAGSSSGSDTYMRRRQHLQHAGFLPSPWTMSTRRRAGLVLARAGSYGHQHQQQPGPHAAGLEKQRRRRTGGGSANPLTAMRRAAVLMNGLLQLLFSTGDLFGHVSSSSVGTPAPDLGQRRGGASSGSDGRPPASPTAGSTGGGGGRWRRMRRGVEAAEGGEEEEDEVEAEAGQQVDDGEFAVSNQGQLSGHCWGTWIDFVMLTYCPDRPTRSIQSNRFELLGHLVRWGPGPEAGGGPERRQWRPRAARPAAAQEGDVLDALLLRRVGGQRDAAWGVHGAAL